MSNFSNNPQPKDNFNRFVMISVVIHVAFTLFAVVKVNLFPDEDIVIQSAIKVDLVGLPEKQEPKKEIPKAAKKPKKAKVATAKPEAPKVKTKSKDTKTAQKRAIEELMRKKALEDIQKQLAAKEQEAVEEEVVEEPVKGNIVTDGSELEGLDQIQYERYYKKISSIIKKNWNLPQWLASAQLNAQAAIRLDERGYVIKADIYESSGNTVFDDTVLAAIKSSSPFPPPEARMVRVITRVTMVLSFP